VTHLRQALTLAISILTAGGIEEASLESEILLRHVLKLDRVQLYLSLDKELSTEQEASYLEIISRRRKGEPSAYITHSREFYGLDFYVDSRVLIPRPETELLVAKALEYAQKHQIETIADIGTGCGNIAICLAVHLPQARIYATDISTGALEVARFNCSRHGVNNIQLLHGSLLEPLPEPVDIIVSNMPYIKQSELRLVNSAQFEPQLALDGGENGLEVISRLCQQVHNKLRPGGCLLLEIGVGQREAVVSLLQELFPAARIATTRDLAEIERVVGLIL
jgi:release factor glutamine methyltransferase